MGHTQDSKVPKQRPAYLANVLHMGLFRAQTRSNTNFKILIFKHMYILHYVVYYMGYNSQFIEKQDTGGPHLIPHGGVDVLSQTNHQCDDFIGVINIMKLCHDFIYFIDILVL